MSEDLMHCLKCKGNEHDHCLNSQYAVLFTDGPYKGQLDYCDVDKIKAAAATVIEDLKRQLTESQRRERELENVVIRIHRSDNPFDMRVKIAFDYSSLLEEGWAEYIVERIIKEIVAVEKRRRSGGEGQP